MSQTDTDTCSKCGNSLSDPNSDCNCPAIIEQSPNTTCLFTKDDFIVWESINKIYDYKCKYVVCPKCNKTSSAGGMFSHYFYKHTNGKEEMKQKVSMMIRKLTRLGSKDGSITEITTT